MDFAETLAHWYLKNHRDLPWRHTRDPYRIWLSEIILQQTRVAQGMPYYEAFIEAFPSVGDLASADEQQVLKRWQGLGYYSRARNLHATAKVVVDAFNGIFPKDYDGLLKLKGVGDYTAAAVASFSYDEVVPVLDGNVFRVLSRYFGITDDISLPATRKIFRELAVELIPNESPALFNQSIMEFGALQCVPKSPDCTVCPLQNGCVAFAEGKVGVLPVKNKKGNVTNRFFHYLVPVDADGKTMVCKRTGKGIWRNLYEFPVWETDADVTPDDTIRTAMSDAFFGRNVSSVREINAKPIVHKLSHQTLSITFWEVKLSGKLEKGVSVDELRGFPFPIVLHNFIEAHFPDVAKKTIFESSTQTP